ncbi:MAG: hypothetical protein AB7Q04_13355 [Steroidobacteraceae bacterium]
MDKACFKCGVRKSLSGFYKHQMMGDGYLNKCKECTKSDARKNRENNLEYYQEYDRKRSDFPHRKKLRKIVAKRWATNPKLKKRMVELRKKWCVNNTIKRAAHHIVSNSIRDNKLVKKPCEVCGLKKVHAHHDDYTRPLDVRWLCIKHHAEHHKMERKKARLDK